MRIWRLTLARYRDEALEGTGAQLFGGRWNSVGTAIAYCASSLELVVLEALVQVRPEELMAAQYCWLEFEIPDNAVETLDKLPAHWAEPGPYRATVQSVGDAWIRSQRSLALRVPAAVLPERNNILLNPDHPRFNEVRKINTASFTWPRRLLQYLNSLQNT